MNSNFTIHSPFARFLFAFGLIFFFSGSTLLAQGATATHFSRVTVYEQTGTAQVNYQADLQINTAIPIGAGIMAADGRDIHFLADTTCGADTLIHWIEKDINTDSTVIWVLLDSLPAGDSMSFYMMYGDTTLLSTSDFNATFPAAVISGGANVTLGGVQNVGWLEIQAGDTLFINAGSVLDIHARRVMINGVVEGTGAGYAGPTSAFTVGNGPGGGGVSPGSNAGSGGGGYGGTGGLGGYDSADTPGSSGLANGSANGMTIDMGSSGGSAAASAPAGSGGGAISLTAEKIWISGTANLNGVIGVGAGQSSGGGAGGGFLAMGDSIIYTGAINTDGGDGGSGSSTANDGGGGGSGGRIKFFHDSGFDNSGTNSTAGGAGGLYGSAAYGAPGLAGTVFDTTNAWVEATYMVDTQMVFVGVTVSVSGDMAVCDGDTATLMASAGFDTYSWSNGDSTQTITVTTTGTYTVVATDTVGGCMYTDSMMVVVNPNPTPVITQIGDTLYAPPSSSYQWNMGGSPISGATDSSYVPTMDGSYSVTVTDSNGCTGTSDTVNIIITTLDDVAGIQNYKLYPNPFSSEFVFEGNYLTAGEYDLNVMDLTGKRWKQVHLSVSPGVHKHTFQMESLPAGMYLLSVSNGSYLTTIKLIKQ